MSGQATADSPAANGKPQSPLDEAQQPEERSRQQRSGSTSPTTHVTIKAPPAHRVLSQPVTSPTPASANQTVKRRPQLRKPTTNIRPVDNATYGFGATTTTRATTPPPANGFDMTGGQQQQHQQPKSTSAAVTGNTRRTFPMSPTAHVAHHQPQQQQQQATTTTTDRALAATEVPPQHVDPTRSAVAAGNAVPLENAGLPDKPAAATATAAASATRAAVSTTRQPMVVVGRPSVGGQRGGRLPQSAAGATSRTSTGTAVRPMSATAAHPASTEAAQQEVPVTAAVRHRARPAVGVQRNRLATNVAAQHVVPRATTTATDSQAGGDVHPSPVTPPPSGGAAAAAATNGTRAELPAMTDLTRPSEAYKVGLKPTRQQRLITRNAHNPHKIVNCFSTKYPLIRRIAREMDFEVQESEEDFNAYQFNLCWSDTVLPLTKLVRLGNWQRSNHFPSMYLLCRKGHLGTTLGRLRRKLPTHYAFYPHTWSMRTEKSTFQRYHNALKQRRLVRYFIMKPNSGCQGRGIVVTRDPLNAMDDVDNYVVQEYVHRPLLLEGKKFDLRIYILLTSIREPSIFMFNDGLVRICTEAYEPPNDQNAKNACKHLTNYAVNKHSSDYVFNTDVDHGDVGNKRNFRFLNRWLESEGHSPTAFWDEVGFIIVKTVLTAQPQIAQVYNSCFPRYNEGYTCFEVLGFDVLIDSKMKPWLMEVNHTPSFATDTPLDLDIKSKLIREVWDIVDCQATDQQRDRLREHNEFTKRNMPPWAANHPLYCSSLSQSGRSGDLAAGADGDGGGAGRGARVLSPTSTNAMSESEAFLHMVELRRSREDAKLKNFARIYPSKDDNHAVVYETIRNLAQTEWSIPESTAGFTINGHQYNPSVTPTFATASGTPLTPAQQQQQDRIRKDLHEISTGNFSPTTGTGRSTFPVARNHANTTLRTIHKPASPVPAADPTGAAPSGSHASSPTAAAATTASPPSPVPAAAAAPPLSSLGCPATNSKAEEYKRIEDEMKRVRRRQSDATAKEEGESLSSRPPSSAAVTTAAPTPTAAAAAAATTTSNDRASPSEPEKSAPSTSSGTPTTGGAQQQQQRVKPVPPPLQMAPTSTAPAAVTAENGVAQPNGTTAAPTATPPSPSPSPSRSSQPTTTKAAGRAKSPVPVADEKESSLSRSISGSHAQLPSRRNSKHSKSPKGTKTPPSHFTLIEPTPEELARLDRLQQDLEKAEAADPEPPSEEESFDLHE